MKTKMFLTSMLVMSLALPAYATEGSLQTTAGDTSVANGCKLDPLTSAQVSANEASFTAQWNAHQWQVSFNGNSSTTGAKTAVTCTYGQSCDLRNQPTASGFKRTGYSFANWTKGSTSGTAVTASNAVHNELYTANNADPALATAGQDVTLYAKWTAHQWTVSFNGNDATAGTKADKTCTYNANCDLTNNPTTAGFNKTGYTFQGWTKGSTSGADIAATNAKHNELYTANANETGGVAVTLYAKWGANAHAVDYYCDVCPNNVCTGVAQPTATPQQSINFDDTFTMQNAVSGSGNQAAVAGCAKVGYHATGWSCKYLDGTNGTESTALANNATYSLDVNARCTLQWAANTIDLSWATNGGAFAASGANAPTNMGANGSAMSCTYNSNITLPDKEPTKTGYTFSGWKLDN